ncbi:MAG: hypothetical protein ACXWXF_03730 [Aeromicrobium sp.]
MRTFRAKVLGSSRLAPHLVSVTLGGITDHGPTRGLQSASVLWRRS